MIEKEQPVLVGESRRDEAPHVLVATKAMGEHHDLAGGADQLCVVTSECRAHDVSRSRSARAPHGLVTRRRPSSRDASDITDCRFRKKACTREIDPSATDFPDGIKADDLSVDRRG
jgi:hypothetical protein